MKESQPLVGTGGWSFVHFAPHGAAMVRIDVAVSQDAGVEEAVPVRDLFDALNQIKADASANADEYLKVTEVPHGGE
jgi:hypothetical protein